MENKKEIKKLHIGCGHEYREGWINADWNNKDVWGGTFKTDLHFDMNSFPYPFEDNSIDEIYTMMTYEHTTHPIETMAEFFRILKIGGKVEIRVPHYSSRLAYEDITHYQTFGRNSIYCILGYADLNGRHEVELAEMIFSEHKIFYPIQWFLNRFWNLYERFFFGWLPVNECHWIVRKKK